MPIDDVKPLHLTTTAKRCMHRAGITLEQLQEAALHHRRRERLPSGRGEVRGRNGITFITDPTGTVVISARWRTARRCRASVKDSGLSRHRRRRNQRRGPRTRTDERRPS